MKKYKEIIKLIGVVLLIILGLFLICQIPFIKDIIDPKNYPKIKAYIMSFGVFSYLVAFLIQALQIITFIFPAPVVWIPIAMVFGNFTGIIICTLSVVICNLFLFLLMRKTNFKFKIKAFEDSKMLSNVKDNAAFIMFLFGFSGLPNLVVTSIYAKTDISLKKYLTLITLAVIPAIISTTVLTNLLIEGKYLLFGLGILIIIILLFTVNKIQKMSKQKD